MKNIALLLFAGLLSQSLYAQVFPNLGGQRAGISAMPFLKNDLSPRSAALSGASIALDGDPYSMTVNPAAASLAKYPSVAVTSRRMPAGIFQSYLGGIIPMKDRSALLVSLNYFSTGTQKRRTEFQPFGDGTVYNSDAAKVGIGYSKSLSKMFSFGLNLNFINERLAQYSANAITADLGFLYKTDWRDLSFAVGFQHFGGNSTLSGSDLAVMYNRGDGVSKEGYGAPTLFSMGVSMLAFQEGIHKVVGSVQLNHPNDNAENIRIGAEYTLDSLFFLRAGYKVNVQGESYSAGIGARTRIGSFPLRFEYAIAPNRYLGLFHTVGITIGFIKPGQD